MRHFITNSETPEPPLKKNSLAIVEWLIDNPILLLISSLICVLMSWRLSLPIKQLKNGNSSVNRKVRDSLSPEK